MQNISLWYSSIHFSPCLFTATSLLMADTCLTHLLSSAASHPGCTFWLWSVWSVWVLVGTRRGGEGEGHFALAGRKEGVEICRKLLLSGSWGSVVLSHQAHCEWMVLVCRPHSEAQMGCLRPWYINTLQSVHGPLIMQNLGSFNV